jgi:hypothetical protein
VGAPKANPKADDGVCLLVAPPTLAYPAPVVPKGAEWEPEVERDGMCAS